MKERKTITRKDKSATFESDLAVLLTSQTVKVSTADEITLDHWYLVDVTREDTGETRVVLYIMDGPDIYGTISPTFIEAFVSMMDYMEDFPDRRVKTVKVGRGKSEKGREFIYCVPGVIEEVHA